MKLWVDDVREAPSDYVWVRTVNEARAAIEAAETAGEPIELIDTDHDAGDYAGQGGDYIRLLDWLEETGRAFPVRIHSMNPVGVCNMRAIAEKNGWPLIR